MKYTWPEDMDAHKAKLSTPSPYFCPKVKKINKDTDNNITACNPYSDS